MSFVSVISLTRLNEEHIDCLSKGISFQSGVEVALVQSCCTISTARSSSRGVPDFFMELL